MKYNIGDTFLDRRDNTNCRIIEIYGKSFMLEYENGMYGISCEDSLDKYFLDTRPIIKTTKQTQVKLCTFVKSCTFNEKKKVTTVVLDTDSVGMSKCSEQDDYDKYIGFALAYMNALFGSKTKFKKFVDKFEKN